jgi:phage shock protein PspC (stress-responsive transcriptional regulator)
VKRPRGSLDVMTTDSDRRDDTGPGHGDQADPHAKAPLRRPTRGRMIAGVAAGLARYFGIDVTIVRIALVVLALLGVIGSSLSVVGFPLYLAGIPLYLACWVLIPEEGHDHSIAGHLLRSAHDRPS